MRLWSGATGPGKAGKATTTALIMPPEPDPETPCALVAPVAGIGQRRALRWLCRDKRGIGFQAPDHPRCSRAGTAVGHLVARGQLATDPLDVGGVDGRCHEPTGTADGASAGAGG